jgi:hypothetical protein
MLVYKILEVQGWGGRSARSRLEHRNADVRLWRGSHQPLSRLLPHQVKEEDQHEDAADEKER